VYSEVVGALLPGPVPTMGSSDSPSTWDYVVVATLSTIALFGFTNHIWSWNRPPTAEDLLADIEAPEVLRQHTKEFDKKEVIEVLDGVHVAIGYALANSIMIDAPEGLIIVDTTGSVDTGEEVLAAFREITEKPVKAIIYTHNHADHVQGASAFVEDPENPPEIWAHHTLEKKMNDFFMINAGIFQRSLRQFGGQLPLLINSGIGPFLEYKSDMRVGSILPNKLLYEDAEDVTIAGLDLRLIHIPGETDDQIAVWLDDKKVLMCGDDFYRAFPNLYAIRGTAPRNVMHWVESLDKMRALRPEYVVPSHTRPLQGEEYIGELFRNYRDAIQYVHDQTVRFINKGMKAEDIVPLISLPPKLAENPYLQQLYGTVEWSVKGVFSQYLGWFSGDPVELRPLNANARAQRMIDMVGGISRVLSEARNALENGDDKWAIELASHVFILNPDNTEARDIRTVAIKSLASKETSANGRNYFLTKLLEDHRFLTSRVDEQAKTNLIHQMSVTQILNGVRTRFMAEKCGDVELDAVFHFTDIDEIHTAHVRNHIVDFVQEDTEDAHFRVTTTLKSFKDVLAKVRSPTAAYMSGDLGVDGGVFKLREFMDCFDADV